MSWAGHMCTARQLAAPAARAHKRRLFALLTPLEYLAPLSPLFGAAGSEAPPNVAQCAAMLRFFQLAAGLVGLVWQAASQAQLHAAHQWQRQQAGLPPQGGLSAHLYGFVTHLCHPNLRLELWLAAALATGLMWQLALGVSLPAPLS